MPATTLATIAVTTMDKAIQAESESMRAKLIFKLVEGFSSAFSSFTFAT